MSCPNRNSDSPYALCSRVKRTGFVAVSGGNVVHIYMGNVKSHLVGMVHHLRECGVSGIPFGLLIIKDILSLTSEYMAYSICSPLECPLRGSRLCGIFLIMNKERYSPNDQDCGMMVMAL